MERKIPAHIKYRPYASVPILDRTWPEKVIERPPLWCSVDLRDGNQALVNPLGTEDKLLFFQLLVDIGFKEIEIGFPSASETEYEFVRRLIEEDRIPDDVTVQVLVQAREHLIRRTFDALQGVKRVIVHLYNSTSALQRRVVFRKEKEEILDIAVQGARLIRQLVPVLGGCEVVLQYSPESFTGTELDFSLDICTAVCDVWQPGESEKIIVNLPATVEMSTPNIYADQIEWFCRSFSYRTRSVMSIHTHNDRGTAVAAAELALMAGADRVEGTLFGNGERTGNVDIVTLALNMFSQGIDPGLDLSSLPEIARRVAQYNQIPVSPRHPYAGDLVFTAFSGSHQDAIRKGLSERRTHQDPVWEVPYLPIDPADIGRHYESLVRINSQSGKGGIAFVLEDRYGYHLPRKLQINFSQVVQKLCDVTGRELGADEIRKTFEEEYSLRHPFELTGHNTAYDARSGTTRLSCVVSEEGKEEEISGNGTGPLSALVNAMENRFGFHLSILDYHEHAIGEGQDALAVTYVQSSLDGGEPRYGMAVHHSTEFATLQAVLSSLNRSIRDAPVPSSRQKPEEGRGA